MNHDAYEQSIIQVVLQRDEIGHTHRNGSVSGTRSFGGVQTGNRKRKAAMLGGPLQNPYKKDPRVPFDLWNATEFHRLAGPGGAFAARGGGAASGVSAWRPELPMGAGHE